MSALVQIRNVPDRARAALKTRAARAGVSLNTYLLEMIEREVAQPSVDEVLSRARLRAEKSTGSAVEALGRERAARP